MADQIASNNTTVCKQCMQSINGIICIVCEGFCSNAFHPECAKLTAEEILCYRKLPNVLWLCRDCTNEMQKIRSDRTAQHSEITSFPPTANDDIDRHEKDIADLRKQIAAIHQTLANVSTTCTASRLETTKENLPVAQSSPLSESKLLCGTRNVGDQCCSADDSGAVAGEKYWLFFTRIKNSTTEREIRDMVADSLRTPDTDIDVKKLVPPWKDASSLPFVSFKVGIDFRFKVKALCQSTWPAGICYREFKNNVWEPAMQYRSMF